MSKKEILANINIDHIFLDKPIIKQSLAPKTQSLHEVVNNLPTYSEIHPKQKYIKIPKALDILSQKKPDLVVVDPDIEKQLNKAVKINDALVEKESQKGIMYYLKHFYEKWISPNKVMIFFLIILIVVLYYRYDPNPQKTTIQNTQQLNHTVNKIIDKSIQVKPCGHRLIQPCVCHTKPRYIQPQMPAQMPAQVSKEDILRSINSMPTTSPVITDYQPKQDTTDNDTNPMFKHNDFSWCSPTVPNQDGNMYMNNYIMKPYS